MKNRFLIILIDNIKTIFYALLIAVAIRSILYQPFYIPSSSMEPTLLVGDRIFVSKFSYGYSKHSFPFSPNIFNQRIFSKQPERGDLVVFKTPSDNRTDYIKRLIGLPGDTIQFKDGEILLNNKKILRQKTDKQIQVMCGSQNLDTVNFTETLPNGVKYTAVYSKIGTLKNSDIYKVPPESFFLMGDNRDCSKDSRFLSSVGYVNKINLVGKASIIFFSNDTNKSRILKFWNLNESFRTNRFLKKL